MIPFANDSFGNVYCFDYRQGKTPSLVAYDHEEGDIEPLCRTFSKLVAGIIEEDDDF
ncbi:SMI1/KNR4 family protein [Melghirimyces thermohalophilus]|uniref:SMI1/KNR4 family protein n=1 Tax=Melghirimyces thermohalophilus TaxID=1236220 RepID=UPI003CCBD994